MKNQPINKSQQELLKEKKFICPHCGSVNPVKEAFVMEVLVNETSHITYHGNHYKDHISSSFAKVRFCKLCKNVRLRNKIIRHISYFTILPLVLLFILCLVTWNWDIAHPIQAYFLFMGILFFLYVPSVKFFREFISPILNKSLLKKAIEGNAIER